MISSTSSVEYNKRTVKFSILITTKKHYSQLEDLLREIKKNIPYHISAEILIIEDLNGSNNTGKPGSSSENKLQKEARPATRYDSIIPIRIMQIGHINKISAILDGIRSSVGENIILMNDDFSHPPQTIPRMMERLMTNHGSMVVASRYAKGGSMVGRSFLRRMLSQAAVKIAGYIFNLNIKDPISSYIAFPKCLVDGKKIDGKGYMFLLEILVRITGLNVIEIPYEYVESPKTASNNLSSISAYIKSVLHLYKTGSKSTPQEKQSYKKSMLFISKAGRFYTVGASGLLINYFISSLVSNFHIGGLWYLQATLIGIVTSIVSNFILNKIWTFQDRNFSIVHTSRQFVLFVGICSFGAIIQLVLVYIMVEEGFRYELSLVFAVGIASVSNFLLNKRFTFKDKLWG